MYCSPHLSTEWETEVKKLGPFNVIGPNGEEAKHNDLAHLNMPMKTRNKDNPYVEAFWKWWPSLYRKLRVFRMTGGEPLMDVNCYKVLDYIYKNPNAWLEISITTNMCPPKKELMDKFIDKTKKLEEIQIWNDPERFNPGSGNHWYVNMAVKHFTLFISLDSVDKQAEYIRTGLDFKILKENVDRFLAETNNTNICFINTFNILSVPKIKEFLEYILELRKAYSRENQGIKYIPIHDPHHTHPDYEIHPHQRIFFDVPVLRSPAWQNFQILPAEYEKYLENAIEFMKANSNVNDFVGFYDFEIAKLERNLSLMKERESISKEKLEIDRKNFVSYFKQYDKRRGTNFKKTFPELKKFYNEHNTN